MESMTGEKVVKIKEKRKRYYISHTEKEKSYAMNRYNQEKDTDEYKLRKMLYMREYRRIKKVM